MIYSHEKYEQLVQKTIEQIRQLSTLKGGEYAGDIDHLANFRRNAERLGLSIEAIWAVYCNKHIDAINQYCADIQAGKTRERLESISGRADDVIVYMILFKAMVEERNPVLMEAPTANFVKHLSVTPPHSGNKIPGETLREAVDRYRQYLQNYHGSLPPLSAEKWAELNYHGAATTFVTAWNHNKDREPED